jgi:hypothetical protein
MSLVEWSRFADHGHEVSSKGDKRFSALFALMPDGRTIEMWYQCDVKHYQPMGTDWRLGKGKPPLVDYPGDQLYELYLSIWRLWALQNMSLMLDLNHKVRAKGHMLTDRYATTPVNQARALAQILNEWFAS